MQRLGLAFGPQIVAALAALLALASPWVVATSAQTPPRPPGQVPYLNFPTTGSPETPAPSAPPADAPAAKASPAEKGSPAAKGSPKLDALQQRDKELQILRSEQKKARERETNLRREIDQIGDDRRKLNRQLIDIAARVRTIEQQIATGEQRLPPLDEKEATLRTSLDARRHLISNVLAALQRIGRNPPPAMLVTPEDALQSVRSAILFGAVLPEMRKDVEALANDLSALAAVRKEIAAERAGLEKARASMADEIAQLTGLTEHRQKQQTDVEKVLTAERQKAALLGRRSEDLQELIAKLEQELDRTTRAARLAARNGEEKKATDARAGLAALKDPGRLAPAIAFARAKGTLPLPVNGVRIREFGATDGVGGQEKGVSISARPGAQITAPCDGWVVYAGPFRNYGQLLILNAGDGYHVLLAGMDRISVDLGQFVVTGEPVAVMGGRTQSPAAIATGSGQPILYVEFRKDGTPVDSSPWWAASDSEK
ncbi:MAG TPA: peptidoglycan DD-metalloendopeptidase family protein, partial [Xanthobacteraceae bacterium]|nr:peptidoglycan DD-metalloendopeptidase family protein [Xanthobacteraceae bacterium]